MRKAAKELQVGDKLVNPQTGEHVSTVIEKCSLDIRKCPRILLTAEFENGDQVTRDVNEEYTFEVQES